ncbi:hypothetical protein ACYG9R_09190 [Mesorhizobium sp. RSR565B]|uniref:hypothetical protein n=1 Tax=Mesorhizobium sp. L103C565B0 TaxID=1287094 RepID=UPI0003CFA41E|nr:hypothetical protein [Mesorhizobium sp. L103C565B0]ESZ50447.1 hypothetical protein X730_12050 [Mesorhizobium sp. L103C565B0]
MSSIFDWSTTPASNANSDSGINWAEGQFPSTVNNSARAIMGRNAEIVKDMGGSLVAGGTANALTVTTNSAFTTNVNGRYLAFRAALDNTAAATLNVNGIGAKSIRKMTSAGDSPLAGAEIQADGIYLVNYSEAVNGAAGGWVLVNPTPADLTVFATLASPVFTGNPTAPTPIAGDNDTSIATTAFVTGGIATAIAALSSVYQAASAVLTALSGIGTAVAGDIIYASGAGTWARRAKGTASQALLMNAGATAPAWATLPFTASFESAQQTITNSGTLALPHSLGAVPKLTAVFLKCITTDGGYIAGAEVPLGSNMSTTDTTARGVTFTPDATNMNLQFAASPWRILSADGSFILTITNASWKLVVRAWA